MAETVTVEGIQHRLNVAEGLRAALGSGSRALDAAREFLGGAELSEADVAADLDGMCVSLGEDLERAKKRRRIAKHVAGKLSESIVPFLVAQGPTVDPEAAALASISDDELEEGKLSHVVFNPALHPHDREGEFAKTLGGLRHGEEARTTAGITVRRNGDTLELHQPYFQGETMARHKDVGAAAKQALMVHDEVSSHGVRVVDEKGKTVGRYPSKAMANRQKKAGQKVVPILEEAYVGSELERRLEEGLLGKAAAKFDKAKHPHARDGKFADTPDAAKKLEKPGAAPTKKNPVTLAVEQAANAMPVDKLMYLHNVAHSLESKTLDAEKLHAIADMLQEVARWAAEHWDIIDHLMHVSVGLLNADVIDETKGAELMEAVDEIQEGLAGALMSRGRHGHVGGHFEETKHRRQRTGEFADMGASLKKMQKLKAGQRHDLGEHTHVERDPKHGLSVVHRGRVVSRHGEDAQGAYDRARSVMSEKHVDRREIDRAVSRQARVNPKADTKKLKGYLEDREREMEDRRWTREALAEALLESLDLEEVSSKVYPSLDRSPKENWVDKAGGLPSYIERIAKHLHYEKGKEVGHAIAIAVNTVKRWCHGATVSSTGGVKTGAGVSAETKAKACAAVAQWNAKRAAGKMREAVELAEAAGFMDKETGKFIQALPPSTAFCARILAEVEEQYDDWDTWVDGLSPQDIAEAAELEEGLLRRGRTAAKLESVYWDNGFPMDFDRMHPRGRAGRFIDKLGQDFGDLKMGAGKIAGIKRFVGQMEGRRGVVDHRAARLAKIRSEHPAYAGDPTDIVTRLGQGMHNPAASLTKVYSNGWDPEMHIEYVDGKPVRWGLDRDGLVNMKSDGAQEKHDLMKKALARGDAREVGQMNAVALSADEAIGNVLTSFPGLKDWTLDDDGPGAWKLHVEMDNGTHVIRVTEDGKVEYLDGPQKKPEHPAAAAVSDELQKILSSAPKQEEYGLHATGGSSVISHMMKGQFYKGKDGHLYEKGDDEFHIGKNGHNVKGVVLINHDTGTTKWTPYFAIHGIEYDLVDKHGNAVQDALLDKPVMPTLKTGMVDSLAGKHVVITGTIPDHSRKEVEAMIATKGGINHGSLSKGTDILVTGSGVGAVKTNKAAQYGTTVIPWEDFQHLLEAAKADPLYRVLKTRLELREASDPDEVVRLRARQEALEGRLDRRDAMRLLEAEALELTGV